GSAVVDVVLVTGRVVHAVQYLLQIEPEIFVLGPERNRNSGQPFAQTDGPQPRAQTMFNPAYHDAVVTLGQRLHRHTLVTAQQVDLDKMSRAVKHLLALGDVLFAVWTGALVARAEDLDHGNELPVPAVTDLQERGAFDIDSGQPHLNRRF